MAYKVLYRKYRPMTFSDVVGQPQVTVTLKNELMAGRVSHAYLFTGSRGTGKTTCAKILAKAVNCLHPVDGDPCGECEVCQGIDNGSILDIEEMDAASNNKVDDIRNIIEEVAFTPSTSKYRVYIIDEVHMLTPSAFNALLKTLEEPPPHVIFILATTEVHKLLPTILSRCQRFDFRRIAPADIADRLDYVCRQEGVSIDRDAALLIARIADGGMRDALSILDQCLGRSHHVTLQIATETAGVAGKEYLYTLAQDIKDRNSSEALEIINNLHNSSKDMSKLCEEMASHFRNLMLIKTMRNPGSIIQASEEELEEMTKQALPMSLPTILHAIDTFQAAVDKMTFANQRIETEMAFIRLCSPELDTTAEALLRRIEALEQGAPRIAAPVQEAKTAPKVETRTEEPAAAAPAQPGQRKSADELVKDAVPFAEWPEVIQRMRQVSPSVGSAFAGSAAYTSSNYILIDASTFAFDLLKNSANKDKIKECILAITGRNYNLGPYKAGAKTQNTEQSDPLSALEQRAREAGIEVIEN